jgi:uncharacterized protein (TIGR03435 family)
MRAVAGMGFIALVSMLAPAAFCQPGAAKPPLPSLPALPSFDIADVHVSPRGDWVKNPAHPMQGGYLSGDRYELRRATMLDLIGTAYNLEPDKVYGGPAWLDYDRFEVAAKTAPGTSPETLRLMLQTLLADRFGLAVKPGTQPVPGYILSKGKGELKLKASAGGTGDVGCRSGVMMSLGGTNPPERSILCHDVRMESFAATLAQVVSRPGAHLAVLDSTGLAGTWDVELKYSDTGTSEHPVVAEELGKLGLALQLGKIPQAVLTVENANERPSPNPPGVEAALPKRPQPEFEVATVRLANGGSGGSRALLFQAGGRVTASGMPPGILIQQAWNLSSYEQIIGLPKSFAGSVARNVSIVAKAPEGWFPVAPGVANNQAREMLYAMLRSLLIDRYKMTFHWEDRPVDALTITVNKSKLTKADPANRTGCTREGQQQQGRALVVKLVCRNMTMEQFAEQMPALDTGIWYPVQDGTGLEGAWDFTLNYDALARLAALPLLRAAQAPADAAEASDPQGSISFVDAVQKQLGLKIETHKRPEKVLVIDHMLEEPAEN